MRALGLFLLWLVALPAASKTCVECHAGSAERSWALSKHGVIDRIEAGRERRRAPDCAGCHVVEAQAPTAQHYAAKRTRAQAREAATESCRACHSPRYTTEQNAAAQRGLAIGEMKRREAEALVEAARKETAGEELARIEKLFATLRDKNLRDLRLGLAHQSPDYQWWLGQAALDGSLLRIKGALGEVRRNRATATTPGK
jgi:mono/diheme cytochrome c family protein